MNYQALVQSAVKGKAPIVAIPREGLAPICLRSKLLKGALKGVTITEVVVLDFGWLQIKGTAGRVRTCAKFAPLNRNACPWNKRPESADENDRASFASWRANKQERTAKFREGMARWGKELANLNLGIRRPSLYPRWYSEYNEPEQWGTERYANWLEWRKATAHLREQIQSIKELKGVRL